MITRVLIAPLNPSPASVAKSESDGNLFKGVDSTELSKSSVGIDTLSDDLIRSIFTYLDPVSLNVCCKISQRYRNIGVDDFVWSIVTKQLNVTCTPNQSIRDKMLTTAMSDGNLRYRAEKFLENVNVDHVLQKKCSYLFSCCYAHSTDQPSVHINIRHKDHSQEIPCKKFDVTGSMFFNRTTTQIEGSWDPYGNVREMVGMDVTIAKATARRRFLIECKKGYLDRLIVELNIKMGSQVQDPVLFNSNSFYLMERSLQDKCVEFCLSKHLNCVAEKRRKERLLMKCILAVVSFAMGAFFQLRSEVRNEK